MKVIVIPDGLGLSPRKVTENNEIHFEFIYPATFVTFLRRARFQSGKPEALMDTTRRYVRNRSMS